MLIFCDGARLSQPDEWPLHSAKEVLEGFNCATGQPLDSAHPGIECGGSRGFVVRLIQSGRPRNGTGLTRVV